MPGIVRRFAVIMSLVLSALVLTAVPASAGTPWWWPKPTSPAPTPTPPPAPTCGGQTTLPNANGGNWVCTWNDEFSGTAVDSTKWMVQTTAGSGFTDGTSCFMNSANNVSVANGVLSLTSRKEAARFTCRTPYGSYNSQYTSGEVLTYGKFAQKYGRFEVRAKFPAATVAGLQEALWMYPSNLSKYGAWPASGEIDIAEVYSGLSDRAIPFVHYNSATVDMNVTNNWCMIANVNDFHTYTLEWTASTIQISFDGQVCITDTPQPLSPLKWPAPFDQPFGMALTQGLGIGNNAFNALTTPLPATTQVDYVRVWS